jgi:hypothetical protein
MLHIPGNVGGAGLHHQRQLTLHIRHPRPSGSGSWFDRLLLSCCNTHFNLHILLLPPASTLEITQFYSWIRYSTIMVQLEGRPLFAAVTTLTCLGFLLIGLYVLSFKLHQVLLMSLTVTMAFLVAWSVVMLSTTLLTPHQRRLSV